MTIQTQLPGLGVVRDVTLRDGLQLTGRTLPVDDKVAIVRELLALGVEALEIGSMARPDLVPPLANTLEVIKALTPAELEHCWIWAATPGQVARALDAGTTHIQFCFSASESHNRANVNRSVDESLDGLAESIDLVRAAGADMQLAIATSFTCPFEGRVHPGKVLAIAEDPRTAGLTDVVICDTLGQAVPAEVTALITATGRVVGDSTRVAFHGHDTWGLGVANSIAALEAGAAFVDGTIGALGGCPFAPGASGNTSIEDLLFALRPDGLTPSIFHTMVTLSTSLLTELGEPNRSRAVGGSIATTGPFVWGAGRTANA